MKCTWKQSYFVPGTEPSRSPELDLTDTWNDLFSFQFRYSSPLVGDPRTNEEKWGKQLFARVKDTRGSRLRLTQLLSLNNVKSTVYKLCHAFCHQHFHRKHTHYDKRAHDKFVRGSLIKLKFKDLF